jgi:hypothetical protein
MEEVIMLGYFDIKGIITNFTDIKGSNIKYHANTFIELCSVNRYRLTIEELFRYLTEEGVKLHADTSPSSGKRWARELDMSDVTTECIYADIDDETFLQLEVDLKEIL